MWKSHNNFKKLQKNVKFVVKLGQIPELKANTFAHGLLETRKVKKIY